MYKVYWMFKYLNDYKNIQIKDKNHKEPSTFLSFTWTKYM